MDVAPPLPRVVTGALFAERGDGGDAFDPSQDGGGGAASDSTTDFDEGADASAWLEKTGRGERRAERERERAWTLEQWFQLLPERGGEEGCPPPPTHHTLSLSPSRPLSSPPSPHPRPVRRPVPPADRPRDRVVVRRIRVAGVGHAAAAAPTTAQPVRLRRAHGRAGHPAPGGLHGL